MLDLTKPVQTKGGHKARVICTDMRGGKYPVIALVADNDGGGEILRKYTLDGVYCTSDTWADYNLINVPETIEQAVYVYRNKDTKVLIFLPYINPTSSLWELLGRTTIKLTVGEGLD